MGSAYTFTDGDRQSSVHGIDANRAWWARARVRQGGTWGPWQSIRYTGQNNPNWSEPPLEGVYATKELAEAAARAWVDGVGGELIAIPEGVG